MLLRLVRGRSLQQRGLLAAIALTAYAGEYNQPLTLEAGFQLHAPKPVELEVCVRASTRLLGCAL